MQDLLLGEDIAAQTDLGRVAEAALTEPAAQYAHGLVLFTSGRFADAENAFRAGVEVADPVFGPARRWIGIAAYHDGRMGDAVRSLHEAVQDESGDERTITLVWLFLAGQHQDHHGEEAIAPYVSGTQDKDPSWAVQLLGTIRTLAQQVDEDGQSGADWTDSGAGAQLLATLKKEPRLARERSVQMTFFVSQLSMKPGERGAVLAMHRVVQAKVHATSTAEDLCARTVLRLAGRKVPADVIDSARKAAAAGDRREAVAALQHALAAAPDDVDALLLVGRIEIDQMKCEAQDSLRRAMSLRPGDAVVGVELARALALCGSRERALAALDGLLADPHAPPAARAEGLAVRALANTDRSRPDDSRLAHYESDLREAMRLAPTLPIVWQAMSQVHDRQRKYEESLADAEGMKTAGAPPQDVARYRGLALGGLRRDVEADAELTRSLTVEPDSLIARAGRAWARFRLGDVEGAIQDGLVLTKGDPDEPEYWRALENAQWLGKHFELARDALDREIALRSDDAQLWDERGDLDSILNDDKAALEDYDEAIAMDSSDVHAWIQRANELWKLDREPEAHEACLKGLELSDVPSNQVFCAVLAWETGDHARAIAMLDSVSAHRAELEAAGETYWFSNIGRALIGYGRARQAVPFFQTALKRSPDSNYDPLFLSFARALSGDEAGGRAEIAARSTQKKTPWVGHLFDYAARRLDDQALAKLAAVDAPGNFTGQACEAVFYTALRHRVDGDIDGAQTLLVRAANECPPTFNEAMIAQTWLAAGPGRAHQASTAAANATSR